jgi:hypothetical protein
MEKLGQVHAATALPSGKEGVVPNEETAGWAQEPAWTTGDRISLFCQEPNPGFSSPQALIGIGNNFYMCV